MKKQTVIHDAILDKHFPFRGPCAFCGHCDARHRLWENIIGQFNNGYGSSARELALRNEVQRPAILRVLKLRPYQKEMK